MSNVFLTGGIKVGKSTIINKFLAEYPCDVEGFKTIPYFSGAVRTGFVIRGMKLNLSARIKDSLICKKGKDGHMIPIPQTFESLGVEILQKSMDLHPDLILMDELGVFETDAYLFQEKVLECLSSGIPVLGVIKDKKSPFLDSIKTRKDTKVFTVNVDNRNYLIEKVRAAFN